MAHGYRRSDRVDALLKEEIARLIREEVVDPRVGFVTVMDVDTSPDFSHARVYVSVMGDEEEKRAAVDALRKASGFLRVRVGELITLKRIPELHFEIDRTLEQAARIEAILDDLRTAHDGEE